MGNNPEWQKRCKSASAKGLREIKRARSGARKVQDSVQEKGHGADCALLPLIAANP